MKLPQMWIILVALLLLAPLAAFGQVPGEPFEVLQQQIDDLQAQLDALKSKDGNLQAQIDTLASRTGALEGADVDLQSQIENLQGQINQLQTNLDNLNLVPMAGTVCAPGEAVTGFNGDGTIQCSLVGEVPEPPDLTLYDDFSSPSLDLDKWNIRTGYACNLEPSYEGNYLRSSQTLTGGSSSCGVNFKNPVPIGKFSTDVKVLEFGYTQPGGFIRARVQGIYFNMITNTPTSGDLWGEVIANINVSDLSPVGWVGWHIFFCQNSDCSSLTDLGGGYLGSININQTRTISIGWNGDREFTFQLDDNPPQVWDVGVMNGVTVAAPSGTPLRQIITKGNGWAFGSIDALFDNVHCETLTGDPCPYP